MSLVVRIGINEDSPLFLITAQRVAGGENADSVNTYHWRVHTRGAVAGWLVDREGALTHRYGDGALALTRRVLEAAEQ